MKFDGDLSTTVLDNVDEAVSVLTQVQSLLPNMHRKFVSREEQLVALRQVMSQCVTAVELLRRIADRLETQRATKPENAIPATEAIASSGEAGARATTQSDEPHGHHYVRVVFRGSGGSPHTHTIDLCNASMIHWLGDGEYEVTTTHGKSVRTRRVLDYYGDIGRWHESSGSREIRVPRQVVDRLSPVIDEA